MTPTELMQRYERATNTHRFEEVAPLTAEDAVYWFNDGSFLGTEEIRGAFERTWQTIPDETYGIDDLCWLAADEQIAVCVYDFHWEGTVEGEPRRGAGRGTTVLKRDGDTWRVIHEHLSAQPE